MPYVLVRTDGAYVTPGGLASSYTRNVAKARIYPTREAAEQDRCGNERVTDYRDLLA